MEGEERREAGGEVAFQKENPKWRETLSVQGGGWWCPIITGVRNADGGGRCLISRLQAFPPCGCQTANPGPVTCSIWAGSQVTAEMAAFGVFGFGPLPI